MNLLESVWPARWIPSFRRGTWQEEEVVEREHFGTYDPNIWGKFRIVDETHGKEIEIEFKRGIIYVRETLIAEPHLLNPQRYALGEILLEGVKGYFRRSMIPGTQY